MNTNVIKFKSHKDVPQVEIGSYIGIDFGLGIEVRLVSRKGNEHITIDLTDGLVAMSKESSIEGLLDSYRLQGIVYLLKPVGFNELTETLEFEIVREVK